MGVHGLWKLIDSAGKPIPIESLENKILAVDVSIWLYQLVKGFQEAAGRPVQNAFLLGLFHRICKLLFYRIKPIFVFDGGVPSLKKKTIAARQRNRKKADEESDKLRQQLLENLIKQQALGNVIGREIEIPQMLIKTKEDMFKLLPLPEEKAKELAGNDSSDEEITVKKYANLHDIDITSEEFLLLPPDIRHDILTELKETRKQNSWGTIHLMPEEPMDFSTFQMNRLLKRRAVQVGLEHAEEELGSRGFTLNDLKTLLSEQGVDLSQRIASDNTTRFIYVSNSDDKVHKKSQVTKQKFGKTFNKIVEDASLKPEQHAEVSLDEDNIEFNDETGPKCLTQTEILQLIKLQNKFGESPTTDVGVHPGTSKDCLVEKFNEEENLSSVKIDAHNDVNDQTVEHGKNQGEDNKRLKLDHENLPRTDSYCQESSTMLQKYSPLSYNQVKENTTKNILHILPEENHEELQVLSVNETAKSIIENKSKLLVKPCNKFEENPINDHDREELVLTTDNSKSSEQEKSKQILISEVSDIKNTSNNFESEHNSETSTDNIEFLSENEGDNIKSMIEISGGIEVQSPHSKFQDLITTHNSLDEVEISKSPKDTEDDLEGSSSDDEFLEVNENDDNGQETIPMPRIESLISPDNSPLEIVVKTDSKLDEDDDMFADVFSNKPIEEYKSNLNDQKDNSGVSYVDKFDIEDETYNKLSTDEMLNLKMNLEDESEKMVAEAKREEKLAASITEQITTEAQELLQLFGIPYIIAPMEAEAQCAYLNFSGQTNGTITDDSDIWLFGAETVYKNFFDQKKFVKQFKASDIQQCYQLKRDDLIMIAMLVGSDYTVGINGVGPVNAIEIVAHFPPKVGSSSPDERLRLFRDAYRTSSLNAHLSKRLKTLQFTDGFPSSEIVKAYCLPAIDDSKEKFTWSEPDVIQIREFTRQKFGWDQNKTNKTLNPILDKIKQRTTQKTLHNYFEWNFHLEDQKLSKRVSKAVNIMSTGVIPSSSKKISKRKLPSTSQTETSGGTSNNADLLISPTKPPTIAPVVKSKTPAQMAREKAAKKLKEIRKQEQLKKSKNNAKTRKTDKS